MIVGLYYLIQEIGIFPMSVANNFCDMPLPKYLDSKTVLIYRPHPVFALALALPGLSKGKCGLSLMRTRAHSSLISLYEIPYVKLIDSKYLANSKPDPNKTKGCHTPKIQYAD
jgi:hypothetical protein